MVDIRYGDLKDFRDLFAKAKREAERFEKDPSADNLFNTIVTVWCLADWVLQDVKLTPAMEDDLLTLTGKTRPGEKGRNIAKMSQEMRICKDITNASKHAKITQYHPEVTTVAFTDGTYGNGLYGFSKYGGGRAFAIRMGDDLYDAQAVITRAIAQYVSFFEKFNLI